MSQILKVITSSALLAISVNLYAAPPKNSFEVLIRKDQLSPAAINARAVFSEAPYKEISPSVTEVDLWATSQLEIDGYKSAIYTFRIDCGIKEYALVGFAGFNGTFWQGEPVIPDYSRRTLLWSPLKNACHVLQAVCQSSGSLDAQSKNVCP